MTWLPRWLRYSRGAICSVVVVMMTACACPTFVSNPIAVEGNPARFVRVASGLALISHAKLECDPDDRTVVYFRHRASAAPWWISFAQCSELGQLAMRLAEAEELAALDAEDLQARWLKAVTPPVNPYMWAIMEREALLLEIGRRAGPEWTELLERRAASLRAEPLPESRRELVDTLTVLRRRLRLPEPLELRVKPADANGAIQLTVRNRELIPLARVIGGDYRSGRFARVCVELRAPDGTLAPWIDPPSDNQGGGLHWEDMAPGSAATWEVDPRLYVFPTPGVSYVARLGFSTHQAIDGLTDPALSVVAWTAPFGWTAPHTISGAGPDGRD